MFFNHKTIFIQRSTCLFFCYKIAGMVQTTCVSITIRMKNNSTEKKQQNSSTSQLKQRMKRKCNGKKYLSFDRSVYRMRPNGTLFHLRLTTLESLLLVLSLSCANAHTMTLENEMHGTDKCARIVRSKPPLF